MTEEPFDETLRRLAQDYHRPPETPREEMWAAIQRRRSPLVGRPPSPSAEPETVHDLQEFRTRRPAWRGWAGLATGIAAALLVGIGLGRLSVHPPAVAVQEPAAPAPAPDPGAAPGVAYRLAATQYLSQAETLLTSFQTGAGGGATDEELTEWAGDLLSTTRLLLDSPASQDPRMRVLLEDLELILAQISHLGPRESVAAPPAEVEMVRQAIREGGVLPKLRTAIPAGPVPAETEEE